MRHTSVTKDGDGSTMERVIALVLAVGAAAPNDITLAQLMRETGLPKATVHRLAGNLVKRRLLEKTRSGYRLGLLVHELGQHVPMQHELRVRAMPFLLDLYVSTRQPILMGLLDRGQVLNLEVLAGHGSRVPPATGFRLPAHATAMGKVLLAHSSRDTRSLLSAGLQPLTPYTIAVPALLEQDLTRARSEGLAFDREECLLGLSCVAAPITPSKGSCVAAIAIATPHADHLMRLSLAVRTAASGISRSITRAEPIPHADAIRMAVAPHRPIFHRQDQAARSA